MLARESHANGQALCIDVTNRMIARLERDPRPEARIALATFIKHSRRSYLCLDCPDRAKCGKSLLCRQHA